jgi:flagellar hook-associated protein 1 FlgK
MQMEVYGNPANELNDRRNLLLDELSGFVDIQIDRETTQLTPGIAITKLTVTIPGSDDGSGTNTPIVLVDHDKYGEFTSNRIDDEQELATLEAERPDVTGMAVGELLIGFTKIDGTSVAADKVDASLNTGALRGYLNIINGSGENGEPRGIQYANTYLNNLAQTFAKTMNDINEKQVKSATAVPPDPNDPTAPTSTQTFGKALFVNSTFVAPDLVANPGAVNDPTEGITAANIAISAEWAADENEIILGNPGNGSYDTSPASQFINALEKEIHDIIPDQADTNFYDTIVNFQATIGLDLSTVNNLLSTSNKVLTSIDDQRQSISGVSENEEAVNMMTYSNHYNAAVRYMTTIDEALNTIINNMGLVGR